MNTVPEEGRGIFVGGEEMEESDIEPFENHDKLMKEAGRKIIRF